MTDSLIHSTSPTPQAPVYDTSGLKRNFSLPQGYIYALLDSLSAGVGLALTFWYALILLLSGLSFTWYALLWLVIFWLVLTYLALPRMHQLFTTLYMPDYFMARTKTGDGLLGDPVNLALRGTEADIHAAMQAGNWVKADPITLKSSLGIIRSSLTGVSYPAAPVSNLYLFGRKQDFAYQQEVDGNAAQRHHVRFWKTPEDWTLPGRIKADWLAAGTYDRSVGLSALTFQITHKIDANIDAERNYIIDSVRYIDPATQVTVLENFSSPFHDRNGGGDTVYTDGNMPILDLTDSALRLAAKQPTAHSEHTDSLTETPTEKLLNHELPPVSLQLVGAFTFLKAALVVLIAVGLYFLADTISPAELNEMIVITVLMGLLTILEIFLYILTIRRSAWARLLLAGLILIDAIQSIITLSNATDNAKAGLVDYIVAGISILLVLVVSAPSVREWVKVLRRRSAGTTIGY